MSVGRNGKQSTLFRKFRTEHEQRAAEGTSEQGYEADLMCRCAACGAETYVSRKRGPAVGAPRSYYTEQREQACAAVPMTDEDKAVLEAEKAARADFDKARENLYTVLLRLRKAHGTDAEDRAGNRARSGGDPELLAQAPALEGEAKLLLQDAEDRYRKASILARTMERGLNARRQAWIDTRERKHAEEFEAARKGQDPRGRKGLRVLLGELLGTK